MLNNIFYLPVNSALLPNVVGKEKLASSNSFIQITMMIAKLGSYGSIGWLINQNVNNWLIVSIIVLFYLISPILILMVKLFYKNENTEIKGVSEFVYDIKGGLNYIRTHPVFSRLFLDFLWSLVHLLMYF